MRTPVLICETSLQLGPCNFGGRHNVRILIQIHWGAICEGFVLRSEKPQAEFSPLAWTRFVEKTLRLAEQWVHDNYVHQVMWWAGDDCLPAGWYAMYCFPAGPRRVLLGVAGYLGTGEDAVPSIGSTCFCEGLWWQQGGDYVNYVFELGAHGERHAA